MVVHYKVIFDISQKGFDWWFPAFGLVFVVVGMVSAWIGRRRHLKRWKSTGYVFTGLALAWTLIVFNTTVREYLVLQRAYKSGNFSVVEGVVDSFHPMPYNGHQEECFSVKQTTFCYSDFRSTAGFNNAASHGGPIRLGLPVRVSYIGGHILRIEVKEEGECR